MSREYKKIIQKISFSTLGMIVLFICIKPLANYGTHKIYKNDMLKIHTCRVYGPTLMNRPTEDWCKRNVPAKICVKDKNGKNRCADEANRIPLECIFEDKDQEWCKSLEVLTKPKPLESLFE